MSAAMSAPQRLVLVSCVVCGKLHEPPHSMVFHPECGSCAAASAKDPAAASSPEKRAATRPTRENR